MIPVELKVKDLVCPEWADEWLWSRVVRELGELVIASVIGFSANVCFCCGEIHRAPVVKQREENMNRLFERLGVDPNGVGVVAPEEEPWAESREAWRG